MAAPETRMGLSVMVKPPWQDAYFGTERAASNAYRDETLRSRKNVNNPVPIMIAAPRSVKASGRSLKTMTPMTIENNKRV
jgi:hypothetical protein